MLAQVEGALRTGRPHILNSTTYFRSSSNTTNPDPLFVQRHTSVLGLDKDTFSPRGAQLPALLPASPNKHSRLPVEVILGPQLLRFSPGARPIQLSLH